MIATKIFPFIALAFAASIATVFSLPADPEPSPTWYQISENDLGVVYSTQPRKRDETTWYQIGESEHGPVYSSIDPTIVPRGNAKQTDSALKGYNAWIAAK
jgi:hypothetical protein